MGEEKFEETGTVLVRNMPIPQEPSQIDDDEPSMEETHSRCRCLYVVGYLGIFYYVIMAIIYILIEYALIDKSQFWLQCDQASQACFGTIKNINSQGETFLQLASKCPASEIHVPSLQISNITLSNSTISDQFSCCKRRDGQYDNSYPYYRQLWAVCNCNLISNYVITIQFNHSIPESFMHDLRLIMRHADLFDQDQTINQAIMCLVFASCVAFFNVSSKIMENEDKIIRNVPKAEQKPKIHKIYLKTPEDIQQIDYNLENIREMALTWVLKRPKQSLSFSESDSEYSWLSL